MIFVFLCVIFDTKIQIYTLNSLTIFENRLPIPEFVSLFFGKKAGLTAEKGGMSIEISIYILSPMPAPFFGSSASCWIF